MNEKTLTLKELMQAFTEAAAHANNALRSDYAARMRECSGKDFISVPQPLGMESMRVAFTANIRNDEYTGFLENGGDINLDFSGPQGNFKGEVLFKSCTPGLNLNAACVYDDDTGPAADDGVADTYTDAPSEVADEVPPGEGFECSGIY